MDSVFKSNVIASGVSGGGSSTLDDVDPFNDGSGVALYKLDGNATDAGGTYNGTATNVTYGTGVFGQAGVFNGVSSYVNTGYSLATDTSTVSVSLWFKSSVIDNNYYAFAIYNPINYHQVAIRVLTGEVGAVVYNGTIYEHKIPASIDTWYHVVIVFVGTSMDVYINNILIGVLTFAALSGISAKSIYFGNINNSSSFYLNGSIDQARIFNRVLTSVEVDTLYNES